MSAAAFEIERKFLPGELPEEVLRAAAKPIEQGYLAIDEGVEVRVRRIGGRCVLTVKGGRGLVRLEEELEIDERRFEALWPLTEGRQLEKSRRSVPLGDGALLEVDEYGGALAGLVVAEVEFPSVAASEAFAVPAWLGTEVTGDERYANRSLALSGVRPR
ncbi:MAG TPA: CYTH domain-containing protein [Capillimicrobium sp.]